MKDRHNRETDEPMDPQPKARPSMDEKDTLEDHEYRDKVAESEATDRKPESQK